MTLDHIANPTSGTIRFDPYWAQYVGQCRHCLSEVGKLPGEDTWIHVEQPGTEVPTGLL